MKKVMRSTRNKLLAFLLVGVLVSSLVTGCGNSESGSTERAYSPDESVAEESYEYDGFYSVSESKTETAADSATEMTDSVTNDVEVAGTGQTNSSEKQSNQKIIKRYDYNYETEHFDDAYAYLTKQIDAYNGYVSSSEITGSSYDSGYRTLYMTARVPAEHSDEFVSGLGELGTVVRQSESAEDVTLQYSDTESRIESLKTEQERLLDLLEKADSLETIIALEDRLTDVRYELESYESKKKLYDSLISYSTIDITLKEVNYTVEVDDSTFLSRIITGLERSVRDIAVNLVGFVEWVIIHLPYFLVWSIIIMIIVKLIRKSNRKRREKKLKKQQMKEQQ